MATNERTVKGISSHQELKLNGSLTKSALIEYIEHHVPDDEIVEFTAVPKEKTAFVVSANGAIANETYVEYVIALFTYKPSTT